MGYPRLEIAAWLATVAFLVAPLGCDDDGANSPPVARDDMASTSEDTPISIPVLFGQPPFRATRTRAVPSSGSLTNSSVPSGKPLDVLSSIRFRSISAEPSA
jgi:hypothetical protein